ncbi:MFS transporter [Peterkaempfera sp. SMS 1(5)a]|uniref:MFS transporter n=1 Tax=Peterkaempfera podocarpi TaxID=3232308 RepID=UPI00366CCE3C
MPRLDGGSASYRAVLALPHARNLFAAAMLARLCYGLLSLPLLLTLREGTGSYAVAGTATGLFGLASALLGPVRARLVERRPAALMRLALCYALLLAALAAVCAARMPTPLAVCLAVSAGICPPPVGPLMRTLWSRLTTDEAQRQSALSLDTAAESTVFALGPVLGALLVAASSAPAVLTGCAALVVTGFGLLARSLRRAPSHMRAAPATSARRRSPLRAKGFPPLLLLVLGAAAALALFEIAVVAAWGTVAAGILTTLFSVGGVLGGLVYGRRQWRGALVHRPLLLGAASAVCYALPVLLYTAPAAGAALLLAGACADVLLITVYQLVGTLVPESAQTEAGAWVSTAYNLGAALGTAFGGVLVDRSAPPTAFAAAVGVLGAVTALCTAGAPRRRGPAAGEAGPGTGAATTVAVPERESTADVASEPGPDRSGRCGAAAEPLWGPVEDGGPVAGGRS